MTSAFPQTPWSSILRGKELDDDARRETLRRLLSRYWKPLYQCVRFGWQLEPEPARQRLEEFFYVLLHTDMMRDLDPEKGRFREFLKQHLNEFMSAAKDGPESDAPRDTGIVDAQEAEVEQREVGKPDEVFDMSWVELLIERALDRFAEKTGDEGKDGPLSVFRAIDVRPDERSAADLAAELEISVSEVDARLQEGRKRFRRVMAEQVQEYALDDRDAREELRWTIG